MDRVGKFELRELLGEGATSAVYLAFDAFAQRDVAIKRIYPEVLKDPDRGRLYRHLLINEASLAGRLFHPHIAQIYDATVEGEQGYIVMEYVPGGTLEPFCRPDRLLPFDRVIEIIFKATRALDYAYHQGITHRDIKPANILLQDPDGQDIKLSDFGAALFNAADTTQISGVGSPAYMSPQQVREMPLNHQTDIYSLGVVMYQLLTGRLPFEATNNYSLLYRIAHETPPSPMTRRADVPAELDAIVRRAMQAPVRQIAENAGSEGSVVVGKLMEQKDKNFGFNAQNCEYVDMVKAGIIDPTKVVRTALQDAASVASLLITTEAMIAEAPKKEAANDMPGGMGGMDAMGGMGGMGF